MGVSCSLSSMASNEKSMAVSGYAIASLHPDTLFEAAIDNTSNTNDIFIQAINSAGETVYQNENKVGTQFIEHKSSIVIGSENWSVTFKAPANYGLTSREIIAPTFFLIGGFLFMIMLMSLYFYRQGFRIKILPPSSTTE